MSSPRRARLLFGLAALAMGAWLVFLAVMAYRY
jgi:hypothetical protein